MGHTPRGPQWELQPTPSHTFQQCPRACLQHRPTGVQPTWARSLRLLTQRRPGPANPMVPVMSHPQPPHMEQPTNSRGQSHLCFAPGQMPPGLVCRQKLERSAKGGRPVCSGGVECRPSMLMGQPLRHRHKPSPLRCHLAP